MGGANFSAPTLAALATLPCWVAWQTESRGEGTPPTKVPYSPGGKKARADAPGTWGTRAEAEARVPRLAMPYGIGGIGIEFTQLPNGLSTGGIDLDSCRDPQTGRFAVWAEDLIASFDTYAEVSPSKTGCKLFFTFATADLPTLRDAMGATSAGKPRFGRMWKWQVPAGGEHPPAIELHIGNRYFAVTDDRLPTSTGELRPVPTDRLLQLINHDGPAFVATDPAAARSGDAGPRAGDANANANANAKPKADRSRSATAFRKGKQLARDGASFDEMAEALRRDPDTADWMREKGDPNGCREARRIFEAATAEGPLIRLRGGAAGDGFFKAVNRAALDNLSAWVPRLFPMAKLQETGAYRVTSADLGRAYEEDLSIHPDGIRDFGPRAGLSPCDLVLEWSGAPTVKDAAHLLCGWLGRAPADFGWKAKAEPGKAKPNGAAKPEAGRMADAQAHDAEPEGDAEPRAARPNGHDGPAGITAAELEERKARAQAKIDAGIVALINRFNRLYMVVNENGRAVILQPGHDPVLKRRIHTRLTVRDFEILYLNETIVTGLDKKGEEVRENVARFWLRRHDRHQYIVGVTFDPTTTTPKPGVLNLWEGFAYQPKAGDWSLLRTHIEEVICDNDPIRIDYLLRWMARMFQRPAEQGETAVVMKGGEGTGKGTIANILLRMVGQHGCAVSHARHLVGHFNAHLRDVIFLFADEAFFAGDKTHIGALKALVTEPELSVEGKFQNAVRMPNRLHIMLASNEYWVVPASTDARRFFVLDVAETRKGDHAYFAAIWKQMETGGFGAMLHDMLAMDISSFNVRAVPATEGLQQQRKLSLPTTEAWWADCLERGYVFQSRLGLEHEFAKWRPTVSTELLFSSYLDFAKARNERRLLTREGLGRFFANLSAVAARWRSGLVGEHIAGGTIRTAEVVRAARVHGYIIGTLAEARSGFATMTGLTIAWDSGMNDGDPDTEAEDG